MLHLPVFIVSNCFCSRPLPCCSSCVVIYIISSSPWVGSPFPPKKNYVLMSFLCLIAIIHCSFIIVPCNQLLWDVNSQNQIFTQHIFRFWVSGQEEKTADQIILSYLKSFQSFNPKQMWPLTGRHTQRPPNKWVKHGFWAGCKQLIHLFEQVHWMAEQVNM